MRIATVHVVALQPDDGHPMHVVCDSNTEATALLARLRTLGEVVGTIDEKPAT